MNREPPREGQLVEVRIGAGAWQQATFRRGQFIDIYGLALDPQRISEWQASTAHLPPERGALH